MDEIAALKILIEADASGMTSALSLATKKVNSFIESMNGQQVNWEKILAGTVSPAIITGIAATFAFALEQEIAALNSSQQAANTTDVSALPGGTPASGGAAIQQSALAIQAQTGQNATDVAESLGAATQALGNYAAAENLVATAAQFALTTGESLNTIVGETAPLFAEWGVNASDTGTALTDLFGTAAQGKVSVDELSSALDDSGAIFERWGITLPQASAAIEALSNQIGMTGPSALATFGVIKQALSNFNSQVMFSATTGIDLTNAFKNGGLPEVFAELEQRIKGMSQSSAEILLSQAGFTQDTIDHLWAAANTSGTLVANTKAIAENAMTMGTNISTAITPSEKLQQSWGELKTDIVDLTGGPIVSWLNTLVGGIDALLHPMETLNGYFQELKDFGKSLTSLSGIANDINGSGAALLLGGTTIGVGGQGLSTNAVLNSFINLLGGFFSSLGIGKGGTSTTPAGSVSTASTTNYYISSNVLGGPNGQGVKTTASQASHVATYGY